MWQSLLLCNSVLPSRRPCDEGDTVEFGILTSVFDRLSLGLSGLSLITDVCRLSRVDRVPRRTCHVVTRVRQVRAGACVLSAAPSARAAPLLRLHNPPTPSPHCTRLACRPSPPSEAHRCRRASSVQRRPQSLKALQQASRVPRRCVKRWSLQRICPCRPVPRAAENCSRRRRHGGCQQRRGCPSRRHRARRRENRASRSLPPPPYRSRRACT